jgi:hypothetical protein
MHNRPEGKEEYIDRISAARFEPKIPSRNCTIRVRFASTMSTNTLAACKSAVVV